MGAGQQVVASVSLLQSSGRRAYPALRASQYQSVQSWLPLKKSPLRPAGTILWSELLLTGRRVTDQRHIVMGLSQHILAGKYSAMTVCAS